MSPNVELDRQFIENMPNEMARPPWNNTYLLDQNVEVSVM